MDLRYRLPLAMSDLGANDVVPQAGDLGIVNARLIAPGDASRSVLLQRMLRRDAYGMPPLASTQPDPEGALLLSTWINQLPSGNPATNGGCRGCHASGD